MKKIKLKQIDLFPIFLIMLSFGLSGCFKGNISVDVKPNGSGIVNISFGMTQQAKAFLSSEGINPLQDIEQSMSDGSGGDLIDADVTKWIDGDYEWAKVEKKFKNFDDINNFILNRSLFNHFSLTRKPGIFQNEFILDAELAALDTDIPSDNSGIDPYAFIEMSFSARLPGKLTEANGFVDKNDPNLVVWNVEGYQTVSVKTRSVTWNWLNIFGILIGGLLFVLLGIYALGGFDSILNARSQNKKPLLQPQQSLQPQNEKALSSHQQILQPQNERTSYIVDFNIEDLLMQINTRVLNSVGQFNKKSGEIALTWNGNDGKQRFIVVKDLENNQISINGQVCLATRESVKSELINALNIQKT
jgi:hypothetical protein